MLNNASGVPTSSLSLFRLRRTARTDVIPQGTSKTNRTPLCESGCLPHNRLRQFRTVET